MTMHSAFARSAHSIPDVYQSLVRPVGLCRVAIQKKGLSSRLVARKTSGAVVSSRLRQWVAQKTRPAATTLTQPRSQPWAVKAV